MLQLMVFREAGWKRTPELEPTTRPQSLTASLARRLGAYA
jgi:hypothetical protein